MNSESAARCFQYQYIPSPLVDFNISNASLDHITYVFVLENGDGDALDRRAPSNRFLLFGHIHSAARRVVLHH